MDTYLERKYKQLKQLKDKEDIQNFIDKIYQDGFEDGLEVEE